MENSFKSKEMQRNASGEYGSIEPFSLTEHKDAVPYARRWWSVRFFILVLVFLGQINFYTLRVNLAVALLEMVNNTAIHGSTPMGGECAIPFNESLSTQESATVSETNYESPPRFKWDENAQGLILGAFSYGYVVSNLFGGRLAEIYGAKWIYGTGIFGTSILCLLTPLAAYNSLGAIIAVRALQGIFEGLSYPAVSTIISRWIPMNERSFSLSFVLSGARLGSVIAYPLAGVMSQSLSTGGWPTNFYVFGSVGVLWCVFFFFLYHETPQEHPSISETELHFIIEHMGEEKTKKSPKAPWCLILTSWPVWVIAITDFCDGWAFTVVQNDLPSYMSKVLHFDTTQSGLMMSLPYMFYIFMTCLSGLLADYMISKNFTSRTNIRKLCTCFALFIEGQIVPALCILGSILVRCQQIPNVAFFVLAVGFNGVVTPGYKVAIIDIAPDYSGCILGITNAFGNIPGFIAPSVTGAFTVHGQTLFNWHKVFWLSFGIYLLGAITYLIGGTAKLQPWGVDNT